MQQAAFIIWDEVPMQNKYYFKAVHYTLCDVCQDSDTVFGGLPAVLGENFAQILLIIKNGTQANIVNTCLQCSFLKKRLHMLILRQNMRLQAGSINAEFAAWLSKLSYDPALNSPISLPSSVPQVSKLCGLYESVFLYKKIT